MELSHGVGSKSRRGALAGVKGALAALLVVAASAVGVVSSNGSAAASSTVNIGGFATCASPVGQLAAVSVYTRVDSGAASSVGTSSLPWQVGLYRGTLSYVKSGGEWATVVITCSQFAWHPGAHYYRAWYQPDWRNTTGDHTWRNV